MKEEVLLSYNKDEMILSITIGDYTLNVEDFSNDCDHIDSRYLRSNEHIQIIKVLVSNL